MAWAAKIVSLGAVLGGFPRRMAPALQTRGMWLLASGLLSTLAPCCAWPLW